MNSCYIRRAVPSDAAAIAHIKRSSWHDTYRGIIADSYLDAMDEAEITTAWQRILSPGNARSVTDAICDEQDKVLGYISYGRHVNEKYNADGEILALYLLREYRGKGLGAKLMLHAVAQLQSVGIRSYFVRVLAANPALLFYRRFSPQHEYPELVTIAGIGYDEIALVWTGRY